jgi:60 kDa SS-A/Ro ribonucleoprotein
MQKMHEHFSKKRTSQRSPIPGRKQVKNSAGGYTWKLDKWGRLDRFLILGTEGGSYYIGEDKLTVENATNVQACLHEDPARAVKRIVEISKEGRAAKNDPALFALAMAAGEQVSSKIALEHLADVARIGTHLFNFLTYVQHFRGWGSGLRKGVSKWYTEKDVGTLAYQLVKYRQRNGWTHRDVLRKAHPTPKTREQDKLFDWVTQGTVADSGMHATIEGFIKMQNAKTPKEVIRLLRDYPRLPWETIPTEHLSNKNVWVELVPRLPMGAAIRNLGRMTANGAIAPLSETAKALVAKFSNEQAIEKARIHPISVLAATKTYNNGRGQKGSLTWTANQQIVDVLESMYYKTFKSVKPTNKNTMLALDISASMSWGSGISALAGMTPREASACLSMVTARTEPNYMFTGFGRRMHSINITKSDKLDTVVNKISGLPMGRTDCALPMLYALEYKIPVETFVIYTDNETWYGSIHPSQALVKYRNETGIDAKLVVVGMVANSFSIADPADAGMLDVVGFDAACPAMIANFSRE